MSHDAPPAYLNHLGIAQLHRLAAQLQGVAAAGDALSEAGLNPVFDLTPGLPVSIHLDFDMPLDPRVAQQEAFCSYLFGGDVAGEPTPEPALPEQTHPEAGPGGDSSGGAIGSDASPAAPEIPEPLAVRDANEVMASGGPDLASPAEPAPVSPGSVRALAATNQGPRWTEEEDARAVAMAVDLLHLSHHTADELAAVIGPALSRPLMGTAFRLKTKLKERISDGLKGKQAAAAAPTPPAPQTFAPPAAPAPAAPTPLTPLGRHVANLPANRAFTRAQDMALLEQLAKGFTLPEASLDMGVQFLALKARAHELLQWDPVLKRFNFRPDQILAALTATDA